MTIYHGSQKIIEQPVYGAGKPYNDYGQAFYCTKDDEMAKEWASLELEKSGFVNEYDLNLDGLQVLDLTAPDYNILNWLAILIENRVFSLRSDVSKAGYKYIVENFLPIYKEYDVIQGYRADDSYFSFANAFLNNEISLQQLNKAMKLGKLGMQIALKSEKAFSQISFIGSFSSESERYYIKRVMRDEKARNDYREIRQELDLNGIYLIDIIRNQWRNEDVRI